LLFAPHCKKKLKAYSKEKKKKKKKLKELEKRISAAVAGVATPVRAWLCRCVQCVVVCSTLTVSVVVCISCIRGQSTLWGFIGQNA
jgi:hypothetical protein